LAEAAVTLSAEYVLWLVLAHAAGDYLLQSDWMATEKTKRWWPAVVHAGTYGIPFLVLVPSVWSWLVIVGTHAVIDRYRLARHVVWAKNQLAPAGARPSWEESKGNGYPADRPVWLTTWLLIIADNTIHVAINLAAVIYL
jgi:hypothetical protein